MYINNGSIMAAGMSGPSGPSATAGPSGQARGGTA